MDVSVIGRFLWDRDLILAAAALVLSLLLLWRYLRAVRRSMLRSASRDARPLDTPLAPTPAPAPPVLPLEVATMAPPAARAVRAAWRGPAAVATVQAVAGLAYALTVTVAWVAIAQQIAPDQQLAWQGIVLFTLFFAWPAVIAIGLVATTSWTGLGLVLLGYLALLAPLMAYQMQGTPVTPAMIAAGWWQVNGPATVFVLVFLARPIRAMGPIVAALTVAAALGVFGTAFALTPQILEGVASIATQLGLSGRSGGYIAGFFLFAAPAIVAGAIGYIGLRLLGRLYLARWFSDQSIQADAVWLTFAILQAPPQFPFLGLIAFPVYKLVAWLGQRLARRGSDSQFPAPRLLLLRVFSLGARSGRLFDGFSRLWRHVGTIRLIAGPDLANTTVEPHEFLDFLAGRLQRRFITGADVLEQRLAEAEPRRDPDGRFRVSSFYCHDNTWRSVLRRLARESDLVLMDLRGFTRANRGCVFELHELLESVTTDRILLVIDASTDEAFLTEVLTEGWSNIGPASPNRALASPTLRLYRLDAPGNKSVSRLAATLATQFSAVGPA